MHGGEEGVPKVYSRKDPNYPVFAGPPQNNTGGWNIRTGNRNGKSFIANYKAITSLMARSQMLVHWRPSVAAVFLLDLVLVGDCLPE